MDDGEFDDTELVAQEVAIVDGADCRRLYIRVSRDDLTTLGSGANIVLEAPLRYDFDPARDFSEVVLTTAAIPGEDRDDDL